jgi:hypothetical protein
MIEDDPKNHEHWLGWKNKAIRYWFYNQKGLDLFNQFRYLVMMIFGVYYTLKLKDHWWLLWMLLISMPVLGLIGWVQVHRIGKVVDWLNVKFSTHYGQLGYKYQKQMIDLLEEIRDALKKDSKNIN